VRNVLGYRDADHEESAPGAQRLAITALSCSLAGQEHEVRILEDSRAHDAFGTDTTVEDYFCSYGVAPELLPELVATGLHIAATDAEGDVRLMERRDHPFFVGTLFMPQTRSTKERPHPILRAFEEAIVRRSSSASSLAAGST
jgi:CTP synthase (UTP-ammonia lyase)